MSNQRWYVIDSSTIFDLYAVGLLHPIFRLPCRFVVTDLILYEIRHPPFHTLTDMGLQVESLGPEQVTEVIELRSRYPNPSYQDVSGLVLARAKKTILITGDMDLQHAAKAQGVDCWGTCWLLDYLAHESLISYEKAILSYEEMRTRQRHPPREECNSLLIQWRQRKKLE